MTESEQSRGDELDEILEDCTVALTGYMTEMPDGSPAHVTDHDNRVIDTLKAKADVLAWADKQRADELKRIFANPKWKNKKVGEVRSFEILDYINERLDKLTHE